MNNSIKKKFRCVTKMQILFNFPKSNKCHNIEKLCLSVYLEYTYTKPPECVDIIRRTS